jgi:transposase
MDEELRERLKKRRAEGASIRGLGREFGLSRNAVRRALRDRSSLGIPATVVRRASVLDSYRAKIKHLVLEQGLTAVRVLEELQAIGYKGGYSILKDYIRTIRPRSRPAATIRMETAPGELAQMDWSPYSLCFEDYAWQGRVVHAFSLVLAWSRYLFVRFATTTDLATIQRLHAEALEQVRGVPARINYDNMTTVGRHIGLEEVWLNPQFEEFARHYGFAIEILPPGMPTLHGKVERPFGYLEGNFLAGRSFSDLDDLNRKVVLWLEKANARIHGTTRERPVDRLAVERAALKPLPRQRAELARTVERKVQTDFSVVVGTNRYSVPPRYVGQFATVKIFTEHLEVVVDNEVVARHTLLEGSYGRSLLAEHEAAFRSATPQRELLRAAFLRLGAAAEEYFEGLRRTRGSGAAYHMARILKLADRYGSPAVSGALAHAGRYGAFSAEAIARVLQGRALRVKRKEPAAKPVYVPERVRRWLESEDVEQKDLKDYDELVEGNKPDDEESE